MLEVIAIGLPPLDRASLMTEAARTCQVSFQTEREVCKHREDWRHVVIVCDIGAVDHESMCLFAQAERRGVGPLSLLIRTGLIRSSAIKVVEFRPMLRATRLSVRGIHSLGSQLTEANLASEERDSNAAILEAIAPAVPHSLAEIVLGAVVLGRRRASVHALGAACGLSMRTVEWRL
jgi:hypothetical protein